MLARTRWQTRGHALTDPANHNLNLSDDVIGYTGAPAIAPHYPWTHLISGHLGRVATREDVTMHQQYIADIEASSREALASVNPGPIFWAVPTSRSLPGPTTFAIMKSIRLDRGPAARSIRDRTLEYPTPCSDRNVDAITVSELGAPHRKPPMGRELGPTRSRGRVGP